MRIIHCADLHLDAKMQTHLTIEEAEERRAEILDSFRRLLDFASENRVDAVLIAGDLFDREYCRKHTVSYVLELIRSHPELAIYYLKGNHDQKTFEEESGRLPENLYTFGRGWRSYQLGREKGGAIILTGSEEADVRSLSLREENCNLLMLHGQLAEYPDAARPEVIGLSALKNKAIDYLALGHIHHFCQGTLLPRGIWCYSGCLEGRGFDECGEKGFVLLEISPSLQIHSKFVPFAKRRFFLLETEVSGCRSQIEIEERIKEELHRSGAGKEDLVKVLLKGKLPLSCEKSLLQIKEGFRDSFYSFQAEDKSTIAVDALSYLHDISLKGEWLRLIMQETALSEEDKAAVIRCGLAALQGEEAAE